MGRIRAVTVGNGPIVSQMVQAERVDTSPVDRPADALGAIEASVDCLVGASGLSTDDAVSLVKAVRERRPFLPVVLAGTTGDAAARAIDAGADRCLSAETSPDPSSPLSSPKSTTGRPDGRSGTALTSPDGRSTPCRTSTFSST